MHEAARISNSPALPSAPLTLTASTVRHAPAASHVVGELVGLVQALVVDGDVLVGVLDLDRSPANTPVALVEPTVHHDRDAFLEDPAGLTVVVHVEPRPR